MQAARALEELIVTVASREWSPAIPSPARWPGSGSRSMARRALTEYADQGRPRRSTAARSAARPAGRDARRPCCVTWYSGWWRPRPPSRARAARRRSRPRETASRQAARGMGPACPQADGVSTRPPFASSGGAHCDLRTPLRRRDRDQGGPAVPARRGNVAAVRSPMT